MISDERLRKKEHVLKTADFKRIYRKGLSYKKNFVTLCCLPNGLDHNRVGFSISSRSVKLASRRNRFRRLAREIFRRKKKLLRPGHDLVFIMKRNPEKHLIYKEIEEIFFKLAANAGLLL